MNHNTFAAIGWGIPMTLFLVMSIACGVTARRRNDADLLFPAGMLLFGSMFCYLFFWLFLAQGLFGVRR